MLGKWLRENKFAAGILLFVRMYLGYQWIEAAYHKFTGEFDATGFLKNAAAKPIVDKATGLIGGVVLLAGANAGRFGMDGYLMPLLRKLFAHKNNGGGTNPTTGKPKTPAHAA